ncbi:MAG: Gfo/Idh/MocA family oxidoreductase [Planctomycetes bacterium]|nr:Gfo/Idh/MocA family oxidoreductase [Planctomycetota bacterium]
MSIPQTEPPKTEPSSRFPELPYLPRDPHHYRPKIGLIGCGAITSYHLEAYRATEYEVVALCDVNLAAAEQRQAEFFPAAALYTDHRDLLRLDGIEVVDITTHPEVRTPLIEDALRAGKHVLSQKPFVLDLDVGQRLADLADQQGVRLAVNQNGRWAPHFSYIREAVHAGLIGEVAGVHCGLHWDHGWVRGTPFEKIRDLILYDFAIHWFDFLTTVMGDARAERVYASVTKSTSQEIEPPLLGQASVEYPHAQASLVFDGHVPHGSWDRTLVSGSKGVIRAAGVNLEAQRLEIVTDDGIISPKLEGAWFPNGFHGTMGELLCAIEEKREPSHSARNNLRSLELCFAAVASSLRHEPVTPGTVRKLPGVAE